MRIRLKEEELKGVINEVITEFYEKKRFLNEAMHYPEFLDRFKDDIAKSILKKLEKGFMETPFFVSVGQNDYIQYIKVYPSPNKGKDINNDFFYQAIYNSGGTDFRNGKLFIGEMVLSFPVTSKGEINRDIITWVVMHELNHVYDDWMERSKKIKKGEEPSPLGSGKKYKTVNGLMNDPFLHNFGMLAYFDIDTETKAFLSTVPKELKYAGGDKTNIKNVSRTTTVYEKINKAYTNALDNIKTWSGGFLWYINKLVAEKYSDSGIPYMKTGFEEEVYQEKLKKWCDSVYEKFIKKYFKVVQYYVDNRINENKCLIDGLNPHKISNGIEAFKFDKRRGLGFEDIGKTADTKKASL